jgi:DNA-binding transcriptional ArsR family regulator
VPRYVRPPQSAHLDAAIEVLGNRVRVAVIACLQGNGPSERSVIATAVGVHASTVKLHLNVLLEQGVLIADPPRATATQGQRVVYAIAPQRLTELLDALTEAVADPRTGLESSAPAPD